MLEKSPELSIYYRKVCTNSDDTKGLKCLFWVSNLLMETWVQTQLERSSCSHLGFSFVLQWNVKTTFDEPAAVAPAASETKSVWIRLILTSTGSASKQELCLAPQAFLTVLSWCREREAGCATCRPFQMPNTTFSSLFNSQKLNSSSFRGLSETFNTSTTLSDPVTHWWCTGVWQEPAWIKSIY